MESFNINRYLMGHIVDSLLDIAMGSESHEEAKQIAGSCYRILNKELWRQMDGVESTKE